MNRVKCLVECRQSYNAGGFYMGVVPITLACLVLYLTFTRIW